MKQRLVLLIVCLTALVCVFLSPLSPFAAAPVTAQTVAPSGLSRLVLRSVRNARFDQVVDYGPYNEACPGAAFCPPTAPRIAYTPNVDVAVIELDRNGRLQDVANVLLSRDYPSGLLVPLNQNYVAQSVRWLRWDIDRWNGGTFSDETGQQLTTKGWRNNPPLTVADNILPGRSVARSPFMVPYPASLFKLLIAYQIMRLVDAQTLSLDQLYAYPFGTDPAGKAGPETRSIGDWMSPMITYSDNLSTRALVKLLHDLNQVDAMNAEFRALGLGTLQVNGTSPTTGGNWLPGQIHMTAIDTVRLLWLIDGASNNRVLWRRPGGRAVTPAELSDASRAYLKGLLAAQGFNEVLSTTNFCGAPNTRPGIPALVPDRWINPADSTVTVEGVPYGRDVRPCNATAEVSFAHKTGLTFNYGSDAGIVRSLPGKPFRRYAIAFIANLGYRYADPVFASQPIFPCYDVVPICYTQRIPALGKQIDSGLK